MELLLLFDYFNTLATLSRTWPIGTHTILNKVSIAPLIRQDYLLAVAFMWKTNRQIPSL